jgi:hypothetical protein
LYYITGAFSTPQNPPANETFLLPVKPLCFPGHIKPVDVLVICLIRDAIALAASPGPSISGLRILEELSYNIVKEFFDFLRLERFA